MSKLAVGIALALSLVTAPGPAQAQDTGEPVGTPVAVFALRSSVVARPDDVAVLQSGQALMLASSSGGMTIVEYGVADGRITYKVTSGQITEATRRQIERAVAQMQERFSR